MINRRRVAQVLVMVALVLGVLPGRAQETAPATLPVDPYKKNDKGVLMVEVSFAKDGTVSLCRIVRSNVPYPLEAGTIDYIRRKWVNAWLAGYTIRLPITFDELPWYAKHWDDALVPPPNLLADGDPGRKLKLRVTFGKDGWAQRVQVVESSGLDTVDRTTAIWVKVHWHNEDFAGKTLDAPFVFKARPAQKAPAPTQPAVPPEPAATPAMKVE
jgi:hypothetical protein